MPSKTPGLRERHARTCRSRDGGRCNCSPSIEAFVYLPREQRKVRKTFAGPGARTDAKKWRAAGIVALSKGTLRAPSPTTVAQAWKSWHDGAVDGSIRTRSGDPYKPATLRGYEIAMRRRVIPDLGAVRLSDVRRVDLQDLVDRLLADGADASTIRNTLMPLRAIYRRAVGRGEITVSPTAGLELPAVRSRRDRIASPSEAAELLAALDERDRPLYATAFYAGLRRGELMALRWEDVDLDMNVIRVERGWDDIEGEIDPKSRAGRRRVPVAKVLREQMLEHRMRSGRREGLVFGRDAIRPFNPSTVAERAAKVWARENARRRRLGAEGLEEPDPLAPIELHECRHTFASTMIDAGVNLKALASYLGHSSITITLDLYGHLMPGNEDAAAQLLDGYLERAAAK
jgi:integrase